MAKYVMKAEMQFVVEADNPEDAKTEAMEAIQFAVDDYDYISVSDPIPVAE